MLDNGLSLGDPTHSSDFSGKKDLKIKELTFENETLLVECNKKEQIIQTLQEKINNLQRRVVFLETDLYEMQSTL